MVSPWQVQLFGHLRLTQGKEVVSRFRTQKVGALLAFLAFHSGKPQSRYVLSEVLWPDAEPRAGLNNLRVALSSLRRHLEPPGTPTGSVLSMGQANVELNPEAVITDVALFEAALSEASRAADLDERVQALTRAADLYHGELLLGYYEDWITPEREHLKERFLNTLYELTDAWEQKGGLDHALRYAQTAVRIDPSREESHLPVIRLHIARGEMAGALRDYRKLERILRDELGQPPSAAMRVLLQKIKSGDAPAPAEQKRPMVTPPPAPAPATPQVPARETGSFALPASTNTPYLPLQFTRLFERVEMAAVTEILTANDTRLLTLTGLGGAGKTRLAIEVANRLKDLFRGAIWFVPVAEYREPHLILNAVLDALHLQHSSSLDPMERIVEALSHQRSLLILDSFEHLSAKGSRIVSELMQRVPTLTCLVTSRMRLHVPGERVLPIPPLPVPTASDSPEELMGFPSVQLLVDRIQMVRPDFQVTPRNAKAVAELCQRLEGIPLAIELAAAWAQTLSVNQMVERLSQRFDLLVSHQKDMPERSRSLYAALEWSFELLPSEQQRFFARLSVFQDRWTLKAAEAVLDEPSVMEHLLRLQECSLLLSAESGPQMYYWMLDTVQEFAADRLSEEEREALAMRHVEYYLSLAFEAEGHLAGPEIEEWLDRLELEHGNIRLALDWSLTREPRMNLYIVAALWRFWYVRGHLNEGRARLAQALTCDDPLLEPERAKALLGAACLAYAQGDYVAARPLLENSLALFRRLRSLTGIAESLTILADVARGQGDYDLARSMLEESLVLWQETADLRPMALSIDR